MSAPSSNGLAALEQRLRQELEWLGLPASPWSPPKLHPEGRVLDVVVVGGGMSGLAVAAALKLKGLAPVVLDRAPRDREGPWLTTARMQTLRSPKHLTGPALDLPSLTFTAWYQAQFGRDAWDALDKIPREQWAHYLVWYRHVMGLEVRNEHEVISVHPRADGVVALQVRHGQCVEQYLTRRVVLALGLDAFGKPQVPEYVHTLPRDRWSHSVDALDYSQLRDRRVAVVGSSAAAMDCAASALEAGAHSVDLLIRRPDFPRLNRSKGSGSAGLLSAYQSLPDEWKWRLAHTIAVEQIAPPRGSTLRVSRHDNVRFNFNCPVARVTLEGGRLHVHTPRAVFVTDHLIVATGFTLDWQAHAPFADFAMHVQRWQDRYVPAATDANPALANNPYLGADFQFQPREPGSLPGLERIHCFCYPAALSMGGVVGAIPDVSVGAKRLAEAISARLYEEDCDAHFSRILAYSEPELLGDEWQPAPEPSTLDSLTSSDRILHP